MISERIKDATRVLGKSQGYLGLAVRDELYEDGTRQMVTAWTPTPDELARLLAGASIYVHLLGVEHPPIRLEVGESA
jgi:hypothetical protein